CYGPGTCNPDNGLCVNRTALALATPCDDANGCTVDSSCDGSGSCVSGPTTPCTALDACHRPGTCISYNSSYGSCTNPALLDGAVCIIDICTSGATCTSGFCLGGTVATCPGDQCNNPLAQCNNVTGCANPVTDGTPCDDGYPCTTDSTCQSGVCALGTTNTSLPGCPSSVLPWFLL
ncbi:MAG TPA: hypothetical protein VKD22_17950, partial [Ramlibacter sp.]|nr:hypothetical protein [Ramlibacter sp.]